MNQTELISCSKCNEKFHEDELDWEYEPLCVDCAEERRIERGIEHTE